MSTWRQLISEALVEAGEIVKGKDFSAKLIWTPEDLDWDREFDSDYGCMEGHPFTAWSKTRVYFPVDYDGAEWVGSVPRNPCDEVTEHMGGGG